MQIVDELKRKRGEVCCRIDALRSQISALEEQRAAFDTILTVYDPGYRPEEAVPPRIGRPSKVSASDVTPLLKGIDKRGSLLRMLKTGRLPRENAPS